MKNKLFFLFLIMLFCSTAFALTTTTGTPSGGVYNSSFEYGTGTRTTNGILGDNNYGWYFNKVSSGTGQASYDTTTYYSGLQSIFLDHNNGIGEVQIRLIRASSFSISVQRYLIVLKPSTKYRFSYWMKTDVNSATTGAYGRLIETTSAFSLTTHDGTKVTTTQDWTRYVVDFTTKSTGVYGDIILESADANMQVWFDDVRLEEVDTVALSGQVSGRPSITVTGVSDFNAIDQADTNYTGGCYFGDGANNQRYAQTYTPTQKNGSGFTFQINLKLGNPTFDINLVVRDVNQADGKPSSNIRTNLLITSAQMSAFPLNTDITVYFPNITDANGTTKYAYSFEPTTQGDVNNSWALRCSNASSYSGGGISTWNGSVWGTVSSTYDLYFKTLFEKQSSAFDLNVCSSGDTICESKTYDINFLPDGNTYTINPADAPLFYSGDNNVYYMQHSDSNFQNLTPSMMASLLYTFDKPTTTVNVARIGIQTNVTLTCTPGTLLPCNTTAYSYDGTNYYTYTTPLTLNNQSHDVWYYSTDTGDNTENINQVTIPAPTAPQISSNNCSLVFGGLNSVVVGLAATVVIIILAIGLMVVLAVTSNKNNGGYKVEADGAGKLLAIVGSVVMLGAAIIIVIFMLANLCI